MSKRGRKRPRSKVRGSDNLEEALTILTNCLSTNRRVVFVTGAGLSRASGIPTFRGDDPSATWNRAITDVGTRRAFQEDPQRWYAEFWLPLFLFPAWRQRALMQAQGTRTNGKMRVPLPTFMQQQPKYAPNAGHRALSSIAALRPATVRVVTQNIDGLHTASGLPDAQLVEVHGRLGLHKCCNDEAKCEYASRLSIGDAQWGLRGHMRQGDDDNISSNGEDENDTENRKCVFELEELLPCPGCGSRSHVMPQALMFDEQYESHAFYQFNKVLHWLSELRPGDALVFVGTSFAVGVTLEALLHAGAKGVSVFNFNLTKCGALRGGGELAPGVVLPRQAATFAGVWHALGPSEQTLPKLARALQRALGMRPVSSVPPSILLPPQPSAAGGAESGSTNTAASEADDTSVDPLRAASTPTRTGLQRGAVLVDGFEHAMMPTQPSLGGRRHGCWIPPVVALARFYGLKHDTGAEVTVDSIVTMHPEDEEAEVCEIIEEICGVWCPDKTFGDEEAFIKKPAQAGNPPIQSVNWAGPTSIDDFGTRKVSQLWFADVKRTIERGELCLLLLERLESGKDQSATHYLLALGFEEVLQRRSHHACTLYVKDPMEGDQILRAMLWEERGIELTTKQPSGAVLDRYKILEATHLQMQDALRNTKGSQFAAKATATELVVATAGAAAEAVK